MRDLVNSIMVPMHNAFGSGAGIIASLHGLNALAIAGAAVMTVMYARKLPQVAADGTLVAAQASR